MLSLLTSLVGEPGVSGALLGVVRAQRPLHAGGGEDAAGWVKRCADTVRAGGGGDRWAAVGMMEQAFGGCSPECMPQVQVSLR